METMDPIDSAASRATLGQRNGTTGGIAPPNGLGAKEVQAAGLMNKSDSEAFTQLFFHFACIGVCSVLVAWCSWNEMWLLLLFLELPAGMCISFLFNAFHEMVHNTAFRSSHLNTVFAHLLGFTTFRGAKWFWCFHWKHHRFTNDPALDPELSGDSIDLDDPTSSLSAYLSFLSGYPFGFERVYGMWQMAIGRRVDPWVMDKSANMQYHVRVEAAVYCLGYACLALAMVCNPCKVGKPLVLHWLLPHCFGAGHLRMYQFAEHRACLMGKYTDTNAWACSRTTATWWFYRKLAWHMPYHVEHHAFPNVPFHKLAEAHELVRASYARHGDKIPSGCDPDGARGYSGIHIDAFHTMVQNISVPGSKAAKAA